MEFIDALKTLIGDVGFPIACCIILFYQNNKFSKVLQENTQALTELSIYIKGQKGSDSHDD